MPTPFPFGQDNLVVTYVVSRNLLRTVWTISMVWDYKLLNIDEFNTNFNRCEFQSYHGGTLWIGSVLGRFYACRIMFDNHNDLSDEEGFSRFQVGYSPATDVATISLVPKEVFDFGKPTILIPFVAHAYLDTYCSVVYNMSGILRGVQFRNSSELFGHSKAVDYWN